MRGEYGYIPPIVGPEGSVADLSRTWSGPHSMPCQAEGIGYVAAVARPDTRMQELIGFLYLIPLWRQPYSGSREILDSYGSLGLGGRPFFLVGKKELTRAEINSDAKLWVLVSQRVPSGPLSEPPDHEVCLVPGFTANDGDGFLDLYRHGVFIILRKTRRMVCFGHRSLNWPCSMTCWIMS